MSRPMLALVCLALTHTLVDACALLIAPLWPGLEQQYGLATAGALSLAFIVQSMPTSISQLVFGFLRDQRPAPVWLWLGPLIAALCLPMMGMAPSTLLLFGLLMLGGAGVGAFHPEAAVTAGSLLPGQRTRGLSIFMFGGALGLGLGPLLSGFLVSRWGFEGLAFAAVPLVAGVLLLHRLGRLAYAPAMPAAPAGERPSLHEMFEGRLGLALLLLAVCSCRLVPNMGMDKVLSFVLQNEGRDVLQIGRTQSLFLASASLGMMLMAWRFRGGWEKAFLIGCPLAGVPVLAVLGMEDLPAWLQNGCLVLVGMLLWGTSPAMVSYAQQMFPRGAGVASAITMGLSWGLGGLLQAPVTAWFHAIGQPRLALWGFLPFLVLSAAGACLLPGTVTANAAADETGPAAETATTSAAVPQLKPASSGS